MTASTGAIKAAQILLFPSRAAIRGGYVGPPEIQEAAKIIDRETHVQDLIDVCEIALTILTPQVLYHAVADEDGTELGQLLKTRIAEAKGDKT